MSDSGLGFLSYVQIGLESAFGAAVAATRRFDVIDFEIEPVIGEIQDDTLTGQLSESVSYQGPLFWKFNFTLRGDYAGNNMIWDGLFGTSTFGSVGGATTGTNPYVHVFTEKSYLNSHSIEFIEGNIPTGKCTRLYGAKFTGFDLTVQAADGPGGKAILKVRGLAKSQTLDFTPTAALAVPTSNAALFYEIATMDDGTADSATDVRVRSLTVTMNNKASEGRFYMTSLYFDEPIRDGKLEVQWVIESEYKTKTLAAAAAAYPSGSPKVVFGSSASKRLTLETGTAKIVGHPRAVKGPGIITHTTTWKGFYNASDTSALKVTVEDTASSIT